MPSARQKIWTHQSLNASQRGNGDVCVLDEDYWVTGGLVGMGWTLIRTVVQGWFSFGAVWNPAGASPNANAVDGTGFEFAVYLDTSGPGPTPPPPITDTSWTSNQVWRGNALKTSSCYLPNWDGGNAAYIAHYTFPEGRPSESFARRITPSTNYGQLYFEWRFDNEYISSLADVQNGYAPAGTKLWGWTLGAGITVDTLFMEAPA